MNSEEYGLHILNMPMYSEEAQKKNVPLKEFLSESIGIDEEVIKELLNNWDPEAKHEQIDIPPAKEPQIEISQIAEQKENIGITNQEKDILLSKIDEALSRVLTHKKDGDHKIDDIHQQLEWCKNSLLNEERGPLSSTINLAERALSEFSKSGKDKDLYNIINWIEVRITQIFNIPDSFLESSKYKTFWPRIGAGLLDGFLLAIILNPINSYLESTVKIPLLMLFVVIFSSFNYAAYRVVFHGILGQTPGKKIFKVKVMDISGAKLTFKQAFMRESVTIFLAATTYILFIPQILKGSYPSSNTDIASSSGFEIILFCLSIIWTISLGITMLTCNKQRAAHDFIAGSVVKKTSNESLENRRA